jgi:DNA-binding NarL/FixJ family response regulator
MADSPSGEWGHGSTISPISILTSQETLDPAAHTGFSTHPCVLVIDDHELFSTALCMALRQRGLSAHEVANIGIGIEKILTEAVALPPGLAVLDVHLGRDVNGRWVDGVDLVDPLRELGWGVLIVDDGYHDPSVAAAIAAGALGAIPKTHSFETFLAAVLDIAAGHPVMTEAQRSAWLLAHHRSRHQQRDWTRRFDRLSGREREVLELLVLGYRAAQVAQHFTVSITTVRAQIRSLLAKLEVSSQLEAVADASHHPRPIGVTRSPAAHPRAG